MNFFSDLGRSLMMPIAALAACGIVLGLTSAFMKPQVQGAIPFLAATVPLFIISTLNKVSGIVFTLMPVLFSISIAMGLAKEDKGVAAFAGFLGYYAFLVASSCIIGTGIMDSSSNRILWWKTIRSTDRNCNNVIDRSCNATNLGTNLSRYQWIRFIDSFSRSIWSIYFRYIRTIVDSNRTPSCIKFII